MEANLALCYFYLTGSRHLGGDYTEKIFTASVSREGDWFVAQCLEVDVASQGNSEEDEAYGYT